MIQTLKIKFFKKVLSTIQNSITFAVRKMVDVAQLVRVSACGAEGRRFEPGLPPILKPTNFSRLFFMAQ